MPRYLMCPPDHFGVDYVINPWMADHLGDVEPELARSQWQGVYQALVDIGAEIDLLTPQPGMPDLVFTSNAGLPLWPNFYPSRFQYVERRPEEAVFGRWFSENGWCIEPTRSSHEGVGDLMAWNCGHCGCMFAGSGFRTSAVAHREIAEALNVEVSTLVLTDPRFPHLDTCFRPLPGGHLLWYPCALDGSSREAVESHIPPPMRHALDGGEALGFAANGIAVAGRYFTSEVSAATRAWLAASGFETVPLDVSEFLKAGGGVGSLVLELL